MSFNLPSSEAASRDFDALYRRPERPRRGSLTGNFFQTTPRIHVPLSRRSEERGPRSHGHVLTPPSVRFTNLSPPPSRTTTSNHHRTPFAASHTSTPILHHQQSIQTSSNTSATTSTMSTLTRSLTHVTQMSKSFMNLVGIGKDKDKEKDCNGSDKDVEEPAKKPKPSLPALFRKSHKTDKDISVGYTKVDLNANYGKLVADPFRMSPLVPPSPGPKTPEPTTSLLKSLSDSSTSAVSRASIELPTGEAIDFHNSLMGRARGGSGTVPRQASAPNILLVGNLHLNDLFNTNAHPMSPDRPITTDLPSTEVSVPVQEKDGSPMAMKRARSSTAPSSPTRNYPPVNMAGVGAPAARNPPSSLLPRQQSVTSFAPPDSRASASAAVSSAHVTPSQFPPIPRSRSHASISMVPLPPHQPPLPNHFTSVPPVRSPCGGGPRLPSRSRPMSPRVFRPMLPSELYRNYSKTDTFVHPDPDVPPPPVPQIPVSLAQHSPSPISRSASATAISASTTSRSIASPIRYTGTALSCTPSASSKATPLLESRLIRRPNAPPTAAELFAALENSVDMADLPPPTHDHCKRMIEESITSSTSVTGDGHGALNSLDTEESIYSEHVIDEISVVSKSGAAQTDTGALYIDDDDRPLSLVAKQLLSSGAKPRERSKTFSMCDRPSSLRGPPSSQSGRGHQSRPYSVSAHPGSARSETPCQPTSAATCPAPSPTTLSNAMPICDPPSRTVAQRKFCFEAAASDLESDNEKYHALTVHTKEGSPSKATARWERRAAMYISDSAMAVKKDDQRLSSIQDASPEIRKREAATVALGLFPNTAQHGEFSPRPPSPPVVVDGLVYSVAAVPPKAALGSFAQMSVESAAKGSPTELDANDADVKREDSDEISAAQGERLMMITSHSGHDTMVPPDVSVGERPTPSALPSDTPRRTDMHATLRRSALILHRSSKTLSLSSNFLRSNTDQSCLSEVPRASILNRGDSAPSSSSPNGDRFPAVVCQPHDIDSQCHDVDLPPSATCQLDFGDVVPDSFLPSVLTSSYLPPMDPAPYLSVDDSHSPPIPFALSPESIFAPSLLSDVGSSDTGHSAKGEEWRDAPSPLIRGELENIRALFNPRHTALPSQVVPAPISTWYPQGPATPLPPDVLDGSLTESNSTPLVDRVANMQDGAGFEEQGLSSAFYIGTGLRTGADSAPCHPGVASSGRIPVICLAGHRNHPSPSSIPHVKHCRAESRVDVLQSAQSPVDRTHPRSTKLLELEEFPLLAQPALSYPQIVAASSSGPLSNSLELEICASAATTLSRTMSRSQPAPVTSNTSPLTKRCNGMEADFDPPSMSTPPRPNHITSNNHDSQKSGSGKGGLAAVDALLHEMLSESIGGAETPDLSQDSSLHLSSKDWPLPPGIATFRPLQPKATTAAPDLVRASSDTARPPHYVGSMSPVEPPKARRASGPDSRLGTTASSEGSSVASTTTLIQLSIDGDHASIMTNPIILSMDQQPSFTIKAADVITLERFCKLWPEAVFSAEAERSKHLHVKVEVEDKLGVVTMTFKLADTAHMPEEDSSLPGPIIKFAIGLPKSLKAIMQVVSLIGV